MSTLIDIWVGISFSLVGFCLFLMVRNFAVAKFRRALLDIIHIQSHHDIEHNKDFLWRYKVYETVEYDFMLYHFWIPLRAERFYKDTSFLWKV